ncbi:hypothetical protein GUJ93_ZPchr0010g9059 [Zizania palustris]|uniref:Dienelactone hydrolase domain-containing protein n=1 Tax=Zizania palustris TaxID=103762 RepID=A0A8J5WAK7_ZIZPA|nr:hypothetical protein GUJ93_ZPchr0010g9388 [Zizania palustris]KAG8085685.1 hypothetical protein GUJ93_ZPchr0010g9059 [Zizania palustris]
MAAAVTAPPSLPRAPPRRGQRAACSCSPLRWAALAPGAACLSFSRSRRWDVARRCSSRTEVASSSVDDDEACELVSGADLVIGGDGDSAVRAYLLKAVKNNNRTGVLLLSDIFGFEDSATRDFAYRVACHGYNVLVPDLFRGNPWKRSLPSETDGFETWLAEQAPEKVSSDIDACTKWLVDEFTAAGVSRKLGVIGFCYGGGRLVETLARDGGVSFSAGVCFYGSRMDASLGPRLAAPVLFVCGDGDPLCPVETVRELEAGSSNAKAVVYAGRGHAFAHRPQSLDDDGDAEDAFALMRSWLHEHLLA